MTQPLLRQTVPVLDNPCGEEIFCNTYLPWCNLRRHILWGTTGLCASPLSWEAFPNILRAEKWLEAVSMNLIKKKITQDQPDSSLQCVGWLSVWWKDNEYCLSQLYPCFWHYILLHPHRHVQVKYGWDGEVDWTLPELLSSQQKSRCSQALVVCPRGQYCSAWIVISPGTRTGWGWQDREQLGRKGISGFGGQYGGQWASNVMLLQRWPPASWDAGYCLHL